MNLTLYFTLGYPDNESLALFVRKCRELGVERIELGFPCSDPRYDGPAIKNTHRSALHSYTDNSTREMLEDLSAGGLGVYALAYFSSIANDPGSFLAKVRDFGFSGLMLPDLITDYFHDAEGIIREVEDEGLEFIPFVSQATPDSVIRKISALTESWIYYGLLPSTGVSLPTSMESIYLRARDVLKGREVCFGFGIRAASQIRELSVLGADGIAIGSALVNYLEHRDIPGFTSFLEGVNAARN